MSEALYEGLKRAGMGDVPSSFSVVAKAHVIDPAVLAEITEFIRVFDRVTTRPAWQDAVTAKAPKIARLKRTETCFFSAWDFHLPTDNPRNWKLIELNDNGSGLLYAGAINRIFYDLAGPALRRSVEAPAKTAALREAVGEMIDREAKGLLGSVPYGLFVILDEEESLLRGRFSREMLMLRDLLRERGRRSELCPPSALRCDGGRLLLGGLEVSFVVNRSTDFLWTAPACAALRTAYLEGRVYVAPNPFTYSTRSDKTLLETLSLPERDAETGITPGERRSLLLRVPETHILREDNIDELLRRKDAMVFKPARGFAGRGVLNSAQIGRSRLRRLLAKSAAYVAQARAPKCRITGPGGEALWADLRIWSYKGEPFLISSRGSRSPDTVDLAPPGGWLPAFAGT